jgi:hypothetical protein
LAALVVTGGLHLPARMELPPRPAESSGLQFAGGPERAMGEHASLILSMASSRTQTPVRSFTYAPGTGRSRRAWDARASVAARLFNDEGAASHRAGA